MFKKSVDVKVEPESSKVRYTLNTKDYVNSLLAQSVERSAFKNSLRSRPKCPGFEPLIGSITLFFLIFWHLNETQGCWEDRIILKRQAIEAYVNKDPSYSISTSVSS